MLIWRRSLLADFPVRGLLIHMKQQTLDNTTTNNDAVDFARWVLTVKHLPRIVLDEAITQVIATLERRPGKPSSINKRTTIIRQFSRYARSAYITFVDELSADLVSDFVAVPVPKNGAHVPPTDRTMATRQSMIRAFTDCLVEHGLWTGDDLVGEPISRGSAGESTRPATPEELQAIKAFAECGFEPGKRSAMIALRVSGGSARDVASVRCRDLDLDARTVTFGSRLNDLDEWAYEQLRVVTADMEPESFICVSPNENASNWLDKAAQSVTVRTRKVLAEAGLSELTPTSIEHGAAAARFGDNISAAARFLGSKSLDRTARKLNFGWS